MTRTFSELLDIWQTWASRDAADDAIHRAEQRGDQRSAEIMRKYRDTEPAGDPIDALRAGRELATALLGEQWIAVRAAREAGATWEQIAAATDTTGELARAEFAARIERYEQHGPGLTDMTPYRAAL